MFSKGKKKDKTEVVVENAMREVGAAMREVAEATAPLKRMSQKNLVDYEADSLPYTGSEPRRTASAEPKITTKGAAIQIKKPGLFGNSNTVINIQSATNIQIGDNNTMVINSTRRERRFRDISPPSPVSKRKVDKEKVKKVKESQREVEEKDLAIVSKKFMGKQWRRILRLIDLDDVEIESKYQDFYSQGLQEIAYQCLRYWKQKNAETATVGRIAMALCKVYSEDEVCDQLSR